MAIKDAFLGVLSAEVALRSDDEPALGYDILNYNCGWSGFHCNYLQDKLFDVFGESLNEYGLIREEKIAEAFNEYINAHALGEPGHICPIGCHDRQRPSTKRTGPRSRRAGETAWLD